MSQIRPALWQIICWIASTTKEELEAQILPINRRKLRKEKSNELRRESDAETRA